MAVAVDSDSNAGNAEAETRSGARARRGPNGGDVGAADDGRDGSETGESAGKDGAAACTCPRAGPSGRRKSARARTLHECASARRNTWQRTCADASARFCCIYTNLRARTAVWPRMSIRVPVYLALRRLANVPTYAPVPYYQPTLPTNNKGNNAGEPIV